MAFPYRVPPLPYQRDALRKMARWGRSYFALFMEQGTGKTYVALNYAAFLALKGDIDAVLVIAPRGVHTNWVRSEVPQYWPEGSPYATFLWQSHKALAAPFKAFLAADGCKIMAVNVDAVKLPRCRAMIKQLLKGRRVLGIVDESSDIASPSAARARRVRQLTDKLAYRMILDGTPWAESPFDLYGQCQFLAKGALGVRTYGQTKQWLGEWVNVELRGQTDAHGNPRTFPKLLGYKNLDQLANRLAPFSYRITRQEALPHLPERMYTKVYFELSPSTRDTYDQLRSEYLAELAGGYEVEATHVLTRMLRLQQVSCGYVPVKKLLYDEETGEYEVETKEHHPLDPESANPRLEALLGHLASHDKPCIIWHRFKYDGALIARALEELEISFVRYTGTDTARYAAKEAFQRPDGPRVFLANPTSAGRGLTLTRAWYMYHYSHYFGLRTRLQADDRFHRIGLDHPVTVVDVMGTDTVDETIVQSHRAKQEISQLITNDPRPAQWL